MADTHILRNSRKISIPPGWIERFSKKHPDRPYYFNENTGECRWSLPLDPPSDKASKTTILRGKKRKNVEDSVDPLNETVSNKLPNAINTRPKLKAKGKKEIIKAAEDKFSKDTPTMTIYREKLAQRKAMLDVKKGSSKSVNVKSNQSNEPILLETKQKKMKETTSVLSSNDSVSSTCSTVSKASSMGSKIKAATGASTSKFETKKISETGVHKPTIFKIQHKRNSLISPNKSISEVCQTLTDTNTTGNRRSFVKNLAKERMENIKKNLSIEKDYNSPKCSRLSTSGNNYNNKTHSPVDKKKLLNSTIPILGENSESRLYSLKNRVQHNGLLEINKCLQNNNEEENSKNKILVENIEAVTNYYEEMEWESIPDEKIMSEVYSVRYQLCEQPIEKLGELSSSSLQSIDTITEKTTALYIVIDTNVFLSNLCFIEEVRDSHSDIFGRPYIVIPWTVLQELDFIKDNKNNTRSQALKSKARTAVEFLNKHFTAKHPRFLGQTPMEVKKNKEKFDIECPDDEILQTCLQIKESSKTPVLLSYDKNLCNKAMIHDIPTLCRNDPLEKIYYLKAAETTEFLSNSLLTHTEESRQDVSFMQQELLAADDIMEEGKAVIKSVLSEVVSREMEQLFGSRWEMHVIIRPPWSVNTVLKCALHHWMAAVSESFIRRTESMLKDLQTCIKNSPEGGRKLNDVKYFLDKCNDVVQTLNIEKYPILKSEMLTKINELIQRCSNTINSLSNAKFKETVGFEEDASEVERRASHAFKVFEDIYAFARDSCGIAADTMGLQCSFAFNKSHPFITQKLAFEQQQDVGINVNKLLQILRLALAKIDEGIHSNDKVILALYEALIHFSSDLNFEELVKLSPLDIYCCMKLKKQKLEKGYEQLQELAIHFCRMANYQCK